MAKLHKVDARPGSNLSAEDSADSLSASEMAIWSDVHGEAATVWQVFNLPRPLGLRPRREVIQRFAAPSLQVNISIAWLLLLLCVSTGNPDRVI